MGGQHGVGIAIKQQFMQYFIQQNIVQAAGPSQAGLIPKRSTFDQINYIRRLREKAIEFNTELWIVLADVKSA